MKSNEERAREVLERLADDIEEMRADCDMDVYQSIVYALELLRGEAE